jgi:hypothetical protein
MPTFDRILDVLHLPWVLRQVNLTTALAALFVGYLSFVRLRRFKRYRKMHKKYQHKYETGKLTPDDAQKIMMVSCMYDMPLLLNYSLAFALFKTYAIVSLVLLRPCRVADSIYHCKSHQFRGYWLLQKS